jgi:Flp pilus assembly pilin Flp
MSKCLTLFIRFLSAEDGVSSVEYAALLSLIVLAVYMSVQALGNSDAAKVNQANQAFASKSAGAGTRSSASAGGSSPRQGNGNPRGSGQGKGRGWGHGNGNR